MNRHVSKGDKQMADRYMKNAQHHPSQVNANQKHNEEAKLPEWPLSKGKKKTRQVLVGYGETGPRVYL